MHLFHDGLEIHATLHCDQSETYQTQNGNHCHYFHFLKSFDILSHLIRCQNYLHLLNVVYDDDFNDDYDGQEYFFLY
jgi:hypothetical protein